MAFGEPHGARYYGDGTGKSPDREERNEAVEVAAYELFEHPPTIRSGYAQCPACEDIVEDSYKEKMWHLRHECPELLRMADPEVG